jgi:hypothetical protein
MDILDYQNRYPDLTDKLKTSEDIKKHWIKRGQREGRIMKMSVYNITGRTNYRFGNLLFFTYIIDYLARENDFAIVYEQYNFIVSLGIPLYISGVTGYTTTCKINDTKLDSLLKNPKLNSFITLSGYVQTPSVAKYIKSLITTHKESITKCNPYTYNNNDVFIHVRLGDRIEHKADTAYEYYDKVLSELQFDNGYISSDTIEHDTCKQLIEKYNLTVFTADEVKTIQFGSSRKQIVLSLGTFSWYIGAFSFESTVYFPEIKHVWHGDIFVIPEWNKVMY